jgi:hypothetical protein
LRLSGFRRGVGGSVCSLPEKRRRDRVISKFAGQVSGRRTAGGVAAVHMLCHCPFHLLIIMVTAHSQQVHCRYGCVWTEEVGITTPVAAQADQAAPFTLCNCASGDFWQVGWVVDEGACEEILKIGDRYNHEQDCEYQPVVCPFNPDRCEVMYKFELEEHLEVCPYNKVDGAKTAQMEQRRRERTDTFNLFTYMTIWVFFVYFLYSSHTFGSQIRHASPALLSLFSLPVCFILAIAVYETSRADASQADVE